MQSETTATRLPQVQLTALGIAEASAALAHGHITPDDVAEVLLSVYRLGRIDGVHGILATTADVQEARSLIAATSDGQTQKSERHE